MYSFNSFADGLLELYELLQFAIAHGMHTSRKRCHDAELQVGMKHIPSRLCSAGERAKILLIFRVNDHV